MDEIWDTLSKVPVLLSQYESYSRPLLTVLLVGGILGLLILGVAGWFAHKKVPTSAIVLSSAFVFFAAAGFYLKHMGEVQRVYDRQAFVRTNRFPTSEPGLVVFDFFLPSDAGEHQRALLREHMQLLVHSMSSVLAENLPDNFPIPRVVRLTTDSSPWQDGITQTNVQDAVQQLNAVEVLWGTIYQVERQEHAKVSLGLRTPSETALETVLPLRDVLLEEDPQADRQFGDGRYELLGTVSLGLALLTYERALAAQGDERSRLLVSAVDQITRAREALNSRSRDRVLQRTLYSPKVTDLMNTALRQAGVAP